MAALGAAIPPTATNVFSDKRSSCLDASTSSLSGQQLLVNGKYLGRQSRRGRDRCIICVAYRNRSPVQSWRGTRRNFRQTENLPITGPSQDAARGFRRRRLRTGKLPFTTLTKGQSQKRAQRPKKRAREQPGSLVETIISEFDLKKSAASRLLALLELDMSYNDICKLLDSRPEILEHRASTIRKKLNFFRETVGMETPQIKKVVLKFPRLLEYNTRTTIMPRLKFLESVGLETQDIPKILLHAPAVMELSVANTLRPRVKYLIETVGVPEESIKKVLSRHPHLLTYSEELMGQRVKFFRRRGFQDEDIGKIAVSHPQVLRYSMEGMQNRIKYFSHIGVSKTNMPRMITRMPQLLSLDVQVNMVPKYKYLMLELGGNSQTIEQNPMYLALSLQNRIIPRHKFMQKINPASIKKPFPMAWFKCSDKNFAENVAKSSLEEFIAFKELCTSK